MQSDRVRHDVEPCGEYHRDGRHGDDGEIQQHEGIAEVGQRDGRPLLGQDADGRDDRNQQRGRIRADLREGAAAPEVEDHADRADRDQDSVVGEKDRHVEPELVGRDENGGDGRKVAEQREQRDRRADAGDLAEDERPAVDRFRKQQKHGSVAHFARYGVRCAEHGDDEPKMSPVAMELSTTSFNCSEKTKSAADG